MAVYFASASGGSNYLTVQCTVYNRPRINLVDRPLGGITGVHRPLGGITAKMLDKPECTGLWTVSPHKCWTNQSAPASGRYHRINAGQTRVHRPLASITA